MNGAEFIRRLKKLGRKTGVVVRWDETHGKGSHGRLYYGDLFTTVKDRKKELGRWLFHAICKQLGIDPRDL